MNIRLPSADLDNIQIAALRDGMPYQTLIASILHKYVSGRLTERGANAGNVAHYRDNTGLEVDAIGASSVAVAPVAGSQPHGAALREPRGPRPPRRRGTDR